MAEAFASQVDIVIDSGWGQLLPSTIVDCTGSEPEITRLGKGKLIS
jgi:tRNA A37 threonylcarbamoyladenosine synthetase subunit TsaC/SUA5/YrdC